MTITNCYVGFVVLDDLQLVRINVHGDLNNKALTEIAAAGQALPEARVYSRLYDFRGCDLSLSIHDLYAFPRSDPSMQSLRNGVVRVAILIPENRDLELYRFYEITAQNDSLNTRIFTCEEHAIGWAVAKSWQNV